MTYLTTEEVASTLRVTPQTIRKMITANQIPSIKIGKRRLVSVEDLHHLLGIKQDNSKEASAA